MNFQKAKILVAQARTFSDPYTFLVNSMAGARNAEELAYPLCAYLELDSNAVVPQTPMFVSAMTIIENARYYEAQAFLHKLGVLQTGTARSLLSELPRSALQGPRDTLVSKYEPDISPSDMMRKEAAQQRSLTGSGGHILKSIKKRKFGAPDDRVFSHSKTAFTIKTSGGLM